MGKSEEQMSQRDSGYERKDRDAYFTPAWVTEALLPHLLACRVIWEPACGTGQMVGVFSGIAKVIATDIETGQDFLRAESFDGDAIVTNPPYHRATEFIERALSLREVGVQSRPPPRFGCA
jgi:hypothetical protein